MSCVDTSREGTHNALVHDEDEVLGPRAPSSGPTHRNVTHEDTGDVLASGPTTHAIQCQVHVTHAKLCGAEVVALEGGFDRSGLPTPIGVCAGHRMHRHDPTFFPSPWRG